MSYRSKRTYLAAGGDAPIQENKENMQPSKPSMEPSQSGNKWGPFYPPTLRTSQPFGYLSEPIKPSMAAKNITTFTLPSSKVSESTKSQSPSLQQKPKASQQQQAPTPLTPVQSGQQQKEVGQQQQHTLVALQRQQQSVGQGQKQLHMSVASQQHQKTIALQQQQKTLAQQSNAVTNSSVPQQRQTTSSDPQQDKQAKFPPLKRTQPLAMSPIGSKPPSEKRVANATMGATKPAVISRTPPTLIETTTLNKIPNGNLVTDEPIQPLHHPFMHMNEDTLHMERSPPSIHALSESRLERDLEDSSSESEDFNQGGDRDVCATKAISSRPRRRIIVPDWPEHVKFDEKEEAIAFDVDGKRHLVKGPVQPRDVWNDRGLRYYVQFNDFNQPLRKGGWHKIKKKMKADIVILVRKHFVIPDGELFDKAILRRTSKYWKNYRYFLRENYFDPISRTDDQNYDNRPDGVSRQNWTNLVDYWYSPEFQERKKENLGELDFYKSVYTKKDGSFRRAHYLSNSWYEDANNKVKECSASSSSKSRVDIENEVFDDLMYNGEQSDIFGVQGLLRKKGSSYVNHSAIEMENLKAEFSAVKKQNEDLRQKNQALESKFDDTAQSFKAIASHLAQVLKEVRNGNASAHLLDGADSAIKLIDTQ
ncbi:Cell division protein FtsB, partial [Bienertia sinuspersici]